MTDLQHADTPEERIEGDALGGVALLLKLNIFHPIQQLLFRHRYSLPTLTNWLNLIGKA